MLPKHSPLIREANQVPDLHLMDFKSQKCWIGREIFLKVLDWLRAMDSLLVRNRKHWLCPKTPMAQHRVLLRLSPKLIE